MVVHDSSIWDLMSGDSEEGYPLGIIWIHGGIEISNEIPSRVVYI